jgi:hypothetical protein
MEEVRSKFPCIPSVKIVLCPTKEGDPPISKAREQALTGTLGQFINVT